MHTKRYGDLIGAVNPGTNHYMKGITAMKLNDYQGSWGAADGERVKMKQFKLILIACNQGSEFEIDAELVRIYAYKIIATPGSSMSYAARSSTVVDEAVDSDCTGDFTIEDLGELKPTRYRNTKWDNSTPSVVTEARDRRKITLDLTKEVQALIDNFERGRDADSPEVFIALYCHEHYNGGADWATAYFYEAKYDLLANRNPRSLRV